MEQKSNILARTEKSNRSENNVWVVNAPGFENKYCRNALKALRYAFFLKRGTGCRIDDESFNALMAAIRQGKSQTAEEEPATC
jgi:hypothetical protein